MVDQKTIIVGAGVIGCSLADELTRRGASVTVIDAAAAGAGTSAATFAWVNANDKAPAAYSELNLLGIAAHERLARSVAPYGGRWFHQVGNVQLAQSDDEWTALQRKVDEHVSLGVEAQLLTPTGVRELEPALEVAGLTGGAIFPKEGWIDVETMCTSLLGRATAAGAAFIPYTTVTDVDIQRARVTTATRDGVTHHYDGDVVILAAGNGNRTILAAAGVDLPTIDPDDGPGGITSVGVISTTAPVASGIGHVIRTTGIALRPARNGGVTFADHPTGGKWDIGDPRIWTVPALLLERARALYPILKKVPIESVSLGRRVLPADGLTIADWIAGGHSVYAVATHSGVTLGAHLAEVIAEEVLNGSRDRSLRAFGLSRFATG